MTAAYPSGLTDAVVRFAVDFPWQQVPSEVVTMAKRCVLDGVAVSIGGAQQPGIAPLARYISSLGGSAQARPLGDAGRRLPAHLAALWNGTAGHAMDWDDTQLAEGPGRPYGLLMHPTIPPLATVLAAADLLASEGRPVSGRDLLMAFIIGFEVGCKIAEAINPQHYIRGMHTSGTIGTFAATTAATRLLGLNAEQTARAIGIAGSSAAGIRCNLGTMTKPLHVGRAAENGLTAALLAREGFSAHMQALDGQWGYLQLEGPGGEPELVRERMGAPFAMVTPGVSVKPYPSGVLTHPGMDALLALMRAEKLDAADVARVDLYAGSNVLGPIRYPLARDALEAKFSFAFLLSAIVLRGRAGKAEFTDAFVASEACQSLQRRVTASFDQRIEDMGWDRIRSRVEVTTTDGRTLIRWADERYRGGPDNPLSDGDLREKLADNAEGVLDAAAQARVADIIANIDETPDAGALLDAIDFNAIGSAARAMPAAPEQ